MIDRLSEDLADLVLAAPLGPEVRSSFATVLSTQVEGINVRLDSMESGSVGPLPLVAGAIPAVDARVLCLYLPDTRGWVVVAR